MHLQISLDRDSPEASSQFELTQESLTKKVEEMSSEHQDHDLSNDGQVEGPLTEWWTKHKLFGLPGVSLHKVCSRRNRSFAFTVPCSTKEAVQQVGHLMNNSELVQTKSDFSTHVNAAIDRKGIPGQSCMLEQSKNEPSA